MITLPWNALMQENHRLTPVGRRMVLSSKYRVAMQAASILAVAQWKRPALKGSVALTVTIHEPDKRRRDIGNYAKLIADALTRVAFVDDSQIDEWRLVRGSLDRANPRAEITVEERH